MSLIKKYGSRFLIVLTAVVFLVGCDQTAKKVASSELKNQNQKEIAGIVNLQYVENDGGMLSLGNKLPGNLKFTIFILLVSVFLLILFLYIVKNQQDIFIKQLALILVLSGGIGNLIDRIINNGNVIDFIMIKLPLIDSGIFNIADFYVTLGFIGLLFVFLKRKPKLEEA